MATIAPTPVTLPVSITVPADGEPNTAASVVGPIQHVANGVAFVAAGLTPLADLTALAAVAAPADGIVRHVIGQGLYVFKTSATTGLSPFRVAAGDATPGGWVSSTAHETTRTILVALPDLPAPRVLASAIAPVNPVSGGIFSYVTASAGSTDFHDTSTGAYAALQWNTAVTTGSAIAKCLRFSGLNSYLVHGATLASVTLRMAGEPTHGALPLLLPKMALVRVDADGVQANLLSTGLVTDASANVTDYKATHSIVLTPDQNNVIDTSTYAYVLYLWNEGHTNAVAGQVLYSLAFAHTAIPDARR